MKASSFCYLWEQVMFERFLKFQEPFCMINKNFFPLSWLYTFKPCDHLWFPVLSCWMHYDKIYATLLEELPVWKQFHFLCQDISSQLLHLIPFASENDIKSCSKPMYQHQSGAISSKQDTEVLQVFPSGKEHILIIPSHQLELRQWPVSCVVKLTHFLLPLF